MSELDAEHLLAMAEDHRAEIQPQWGCDERVAGFLEVLALAVLANVQATLTVTDAIQAGQEE